jgi:hypothetical protein
VENKETISDLVETMENARKTLATWNTFSLEDSLPTSPEGNARIDELLK